MAYLVLSHFQLIPDHLSWLYYLVHYLPDQLPVFSLGILLFFIQKGEAVAKQLTLLMSALTFVLFLLVTNTFVMIFPSEFLFGVAFVLLAIVLNKSSSKIFVNPLFINLGKVSYSVYIVHSAILYWLAKYHFLNYIPITNSLTAIINYLLRFLIVAVLSYLISFCTYNLIERQFQKIGRLLNR